MVEGWGGGMRLRGEGMRWSVGVMVGWSTDEVKCMCLCVIAYVYACGDR